MEWNLWSRTKRIRDHHGVSKCVRLTPAGELIFAARLRGVAAGESDGDVGEGAAAARAEARGDGGEAAAGRAGQEEPRHPQRRQDRGRE